MTSQPTRSIIRWAGSKKKLLPVLRQFVPKSIKRYIEPFCGSICFFVDQKPKKAILSDNNPELIHFYQRIKHHPAHIGKIARSMPTTDEHYYGLRSIDPSSLPADERAARFLYLNRFCFNGVYRTNKSGTFNVPRGKHMGKIPSIEEITEFGRLIRPVDFYVSDFEDVLNMAHGGDFVYLDPPYAGTGTRNRGEYGNQAFQETDIARLTGACKRASDRGAKVLISYAEVERVIKVFDDWNVDQLLVSRSVSGFAHGRSVVNEVLISNYQVDTSGA